MKRLIVFTEDELRQKFIEFANNFYKQAHKEFGVNLYSCNGVMLNDIDSITGNLYLIWQDTFKEKE